MKQVIEQIKGLFETLTTRLEKAEMEKRTLAEKGAKLKEKEAKSDVRDDNLNTREIAVKKIEDVKALADTTEEAIKQLAIDNATSKKQKEAFVSYQAQFKKECQDKISRLDAGLAANESKEKALAEKEEEYKKKFKKIREEVINSIK